MREEPFDRQIRETLIEEAQKVSLSRQRQEKIMAEISAVKQEKGRGNIMRFQSGKKIIIAAAAMCVFAAFGVMAAGKIVGMRTSVQNDKPNYTEFSQVAGAEGILGFKPDAVETYSNGLAFQKGFLADVQGYDDAGNVVQVKPELSLEYKKGGSRVTMSAMKPFEDNQNNRERAVRTEEYKGFTIYYYEDRYLFVSADYEPDENMKKEEAAGRLFISYGLPDHEDGTPADPQETIMYSVTWDNGGAEYLLLSSGDVPITGDSLIGMAKETIDAGLNR